MVSDPFCRWKKSTTDDLLSAECRVAKFMLSCGRYVTLITVRWRWKFNLPTGRSTSCNNIINFRYNWFLSDALYDCSPASKSWCWWYRMPLKVPRRILQFPEIIYFTMKFLQLFTKFVCMCVINFIIFLSLCLSGIN